MDWKYDPGYLLVLVRIWNEVIGDDKMEWRGQIKNIASGEVRYFRDLQTLLSYFKQRLQSYSLSSDDNPSYGTGKNGEA